MKNHEISDFNRDVLERSKSQPVLVDFWAEWCGPCRVLGPVLERLETKGAGRWVLAKVNTDVHREIAAKFGIRGIPNVKLFIDGNVVNEFTGALPERAVEQWLEKSLPNPNSGMIRDAQELLGRGDIGGARLALEGLVKDSPGDEQARVLLARTYVFDSPSRALELAGSVEEHSEYYGDAEALKTITGLLERRGKSETFPQSPARGAYIGAVASLGKQDFDSALEGFVAALREDRGYDNEGPRRAVIAIFKILGDEHPLTLKHRRAFSSALFA
jgi:putative thioredoxin